MKKLKILPSILMLITCVAILGVGVFAVAPTQNTISGTITINSANPEVLISVFGHKADGSVDESNIIMEETPARSGINIDLQTLVFDTSTCNTEEDLAKLDKKFTIRIKNPSSSNLGVYFSDKPMTDEATSDDIAKEKSLKDSTGSSTNVKTVMEGYKKLSAKSASTNGSVDTTITFKLLSFMEDNASINLSADENKIYLNIENFNSQINVKGDSYYQALGYTVVGQGQTTLTQLMVSSAVPSTAKVKISDSITEIGENAFQNRTSLTSIVIPENVQTMGRYAFYGCTALETIYFNAIAMNDGTFSKAWFDHCGETGTDVTAYIGANVTKIPAYLFHPEDGGHHSFERLANVIFEEGSQCTSIGAYAFAELPRLKSIMIPSSISSIGFSAFADSFNRYGALTTITIDGCRNLTLGTFSLDSSKLTKIIVTAGTTLTAPYALPEGWSATEIATTHTTTVEYTKN